MKIDNEIITYSSGRTNYFPGGVIGINKNLIVQNIDKNSFEDKMELANYMIDQWNKFIDNIILNYLNKDINN